MMGVSRVIGAGGDGFKQDASDFEREREISLYRSGSAPPSIEGSLAAVGGLYTGIGNGDGFMADEALRSDPTYVSYYYSHMNLNPRLPPPMLSKEDWRMMQQLQAGGGDRRKVRRGDEGGSSLFSMQPGFGLQNEGELEPRKAPGSGEWLPLGRQKSFAEIFQDDLGGTTPISGHSSRPASRSPLPDVDEYGSLDPQLLARAPSPRLPPGVRRDGLDANPNNGSRPFNTVLPTEVESDDILAALSSMSLSNSGALDAENIAQVKLQQEINDHQNFLFDLQGSQNHKQHLGMPSIPQSAKSLYSDSARRFGGLADLRNSTSRPSAPSGASLGRSAPYQNGDGLNSPFISYGSGGYSRQLPSMMDDNFGTANLSPLFGNMAAGSAIPSLGIDSRVHLTGPNDLPNLERIGNLKAASDPLYMQYLKTAGYASERVDNSYMNLLEVQRACLGAYIQSQEQYGMPFLGKSAALNNGYYDDSSFGMSVTHPGKTRLASPIFPVSPVGPGSPLRHGERNGHFPSGLRSFSGGITGWHSDFNGGMEETFPCSLLEEFKSNKTRCFELCEIAGHVVEFSADQYGSRFIQQKLETATTAEKDMVYEEIMSQALSLMTDVFGNYVVQKFFEHGSAAQVRELANQLNGHVLALSLQMYGCRVIQKAIEVVDLDQKTKMVAELDGHVIRCVRDQNGNHVIQKCIECIPQDSIHFIISTFYDQIVTLSTHPYGCRVVQRMLEYCDSPKTQQIVMKEIMRCVCMLAQDQYGNYVVQHVLEYGKPHERSAIIEKLTGQIVQMSQQKFASNVVEKCLTFCGLEERQTLVKEMLGSTDENEPLQAMMKDQFGNYVVQKVLETCDDQQRELILTRIKIHLNALKKYTYGKHIVARVEKLVAAGERRIGLQNPYPPSRME